ncbi:tetratricopeptide repeat protein [Prochlorococcus marinus]|uniref:tetratricopeptide repeat protein n=1 Tax=Prochlorococcus marinus TaxID=1219 RepID=UPI0022B4937E|nr:tetratricopeptide repeat protein [Prochlorococcus marinus]
MTIKKGDKITKDQIMNQAFKFHSQGKILEAIKYYQSFINLGFEDHIVFSNYGVILTGIGKKNEAVSLYRKAIEVKNDFPDAHYNLGNVLKDLGKLEEAELSFRKAIELNSVCRDANLNLANVLRELGNLNEAELFTRKTIELDFGFAEAHYNLGQILCDLGKIEEAELSLRKAITLKPDFVYAHYNLGNLISNHGKEKDAIKHYLFALEKEPNNLNFNVISKLRLSPIMNDVAQIETERIEYKNQLQKIKNKKNIYYNNENVFDTNLFYLAYHNKLDDKIILEELSKVISNVKGVVFDGFSRKEYLVNSINKNNLRLGICSEFLRENHTIGKLYINVLLDLLLKTDLEIIVYVPPINKSNSDVELIRNLFKQVIELPNSTYKACELIFSDKLDILFYPDIGMSNYTYILALSRLALVQVTSLGHPNTSGIKNIDYFITNDITPHHPSSSYTERLVRFSRLPFNYPIPKINESKLTYNNRLDLDNKFIIGLTQSIFKLHPNFDKVLASILQEINNAYLILIKDRNENRTEDLKNRWKKHNNILLEKSIFLKRMSQDDFINITKNCQIMLDPFYFGSGNTYYESMAFGVPFITYPFSQRGSLVASGYKQMQVKKPPIACTPEDYIYLCKKYATNSLFLHNTKKDLKERAHKYLFNDNTIFKEYYNFFTAAVEKAREGEYLENNWKPFTSITN